jgi:histidinol-phosphate aminotransferase
LKFFEDAFRKLGLRFVPSAANFVLVHVRDGARVCAELQKLGIITRPMAGYQLPEWIRITVGTPAENERCLAGLRNLLE